MTHCDECVHFGFQESLFLEAHKRVVKRKGREDQVIYEPEAMLNLHTPKAVCGMSVPMAFQMPIELNDDWGFRPWRRCEHFRAKEEAA